MRAPVPHLVFLASITLALAACEPTWQGNAPVSRGAAASAKGCGGTVKVSGGETVFSLARRCNVSVREVIEANDLKPPYVLSAGQFLRMPGGGSEYVVQRGDTLLALARKLKVDFQSLARANGKASPYVIQVGERLRVPGAFSGGTQVAYSPESTGSLVIASPNTPAGKKAAKAKGPADLPPPMPAPEPEARHTAFQPQQVVPPPPPPMAGKGFVWPLRGDVIAEYGPMAKGQHNDGINIAAAKGSPVRAAENGVVVYAGNELKGFGNLLLVKHADGWMTAYAHNDQFMVGKGDSVKKGQQISTVGATGSVTSPQLHFEIRRGTEAVNPMDYLSGAPAISLFGLGGDPEA